jgi:trehalose 6-phosphate synthase/phosphatase
MKTPAAARPTRRIRELLKRLGEDEANEVVIISGRSRQDLETWFGDLPLALAAEHGALFRRRGGQHWHKTTTGNNAWQERVASILEDYSSRTPGSFVEYKDLSLVWHYRNASPYYSQKHLVQLRRLLRPIAKAENLTLGDSHKALDVHPRDISKARAAQEWLIHTHDFVLCIGDDTTDENMFAVLPPEAYSIKVGRGATAARLRAKDVDAVLSLLDKL